MFPILTKKGQRIFCIHFFLQNKLKLAKKCRARFFCWIRGHIENFLADLEEKTSRTFVHKVLFQSLHYWMILRFCSLVCITSLLKILPVFVFRHILAAVHFNFNLHRDYTGITEIRVGIPVSLNFFRLSFHNCISCVFDCSDLFCL